MTDDSNNVYVSGSSADSFHGYPIPSPKFVTSKYNQTNITGLPAITHDPDSVRATAFTTVTFTVLATGNGPLTYQWNYNNQPMPGRTDASLILTNVAEGANGAYSVAISNSVGWIRSREANLTLDIPPVIDEQPVSLGWALGETALLRVLAHGDLPLSFQWQCNGTNFGGQTNATNIYSLASSSLILSNVSQANQGDYRVIVSNSFGMVTSAVARVHISQQIHAQWSSSFNGPSSDPYLYYASGFTATDAGGNIYFSGSAGNLATNGDYLTVKLDPAGHQLWSKRYEGTGANDFPTDMAVDRWGNVYVTGLSQNTNGIYGAATIKYDTNGNELWAIRDDGTNDSSSYTGQIAVDDAGNVFTAGASYDTSYYSSYVTTKYSSTGERVWQVYAQPIGYGAAYGLALDHSGGVLVTGSGGTIKYSSAGNELWRSASTYGFRIKTDTNDNVYVLTFAQTIGTEVDYAVEKDDADGHLLWLSTYAGCGDAYDNGTHFSVAADGSVYVGGTSSSDGKGDYLTVKFDPNGQLLWAARFSNESTSYSSLRGLVIDGYGNVYITGISAPGSTGFLTTIKYDPNGNQVWATGMRHQTEFWIALALLLANQTNILVTGVTIGQEPFFNYTVVAYEQNNIPGLPKILTPPQGQMVFVNSNAVLNVTGSGGTLQYQWRHFGSNIPGATNSSLTIPKFQPQDGAIIQ